jgi:hypothetical protein
MRIPLAQICALALCATAATQDYVVLCAAKPGDPYHKVAERLATERRAPLVDFDPRDLRPILREFQVSSPRWVAVVLRPEQLDFALQRAFLQMATEVDDDPFVDFEFGYITGRSADDALSLVTTALARKPQRVTGLAQVSGGADNSIRREQPYRLRTATLPCVQGQVQGGKKFPEHDRAFVKTLRPDMESSSAVTFIGMACPSTSSAERTPRTSRPCGCEVPSC